MMKRARLVRSFSLSGKKGDSPIYSNIFFLILNLAFFGILLLFIYTSSTGALVYEQSYAKEIGLLLDNAQPGMKLTINMADALAIAQKNKFNGEFVKIDTNTNEVIVKLSSSGGYTYKFFTNYDVSSGFVGDKFVINVKNIKDVLKEEK